MTYLGGTSFSHCPKCGQQLIGGQFLCGHKPTQSQSVEGVRFDPEKVKRTPAFMCTGIETEYILASDYDQLLQLYKPPQGSGVAVKAPMGIEWPESLVSDESIAYYANSGTTVSKHCMRKMAIELQQYRALKSREK